MQKQKQKATQRNGQQQATPSTEQRSTTVNQTLTMSTMQKLTETKTKSNGTKHETERQKETTPRTTNEQQQETAQHNNVQQQETRGWKTHTEAGGQF
jgi:hypothetical protein